MPENTVFEKVEYALEALFMSVKILYNNDSSLMDDDVHEQAISYKIAHNFENILNLNSILSKNNLSVDVEYNKHSDLDKKMFNFEKTSHKKQLQEIYNEIKDIEKNKYKEKHKKELNEGELEERVNNKAMRPDIILHRRENNDSNVLVIELKKEKEKTNFDELKLKILLTLFLTANIYVSFKYYMYLQKLTFVFLNSI